jgi:UDP-N-acetylmuramate dehydrogenase
MSESLQGLLQSQVALAPYSSWRVGGIARKFFRPRNISELVLVIKVIPKEELIFYLGLGSNTLIRDGGIPGVVIVLQGRLKSMTLESNHLIRVEAGAACAQFARFAARSDVAGLEFLAGIPGTIGGALAMNAGCHQSEIWDFVTQVETLNRQGIIKLRDKSEFQVEYRSVTGLGNECFVAAHIQGQAGDKHVSLQRINTLLNHRSETQPINLPNGGCVFRNPVNDHAARLIDACGLKGKQCGSAWVSEKHANFIVHDGKASAYEIESLIKEIEAAVLQQTGVKLEREVKIVGEYAS